MFDLAYTLDDLSLVPAYSDLSSRRDVDLTTFLTRDPDIKIKIPIIASPMKTVAGYELANALTKVGGVAVIHRFHAADEDDGIKLQVEELNKCTGLVGVAIGVRGKWRTRVEKAIENGAAFIMVDIAHGDHQLQYDLISEYKKTYSDMPIIAANVVTPEAVNALCDLGVNGIRINLGNGSLCTTRLMTGCGVPSATAMLECRKVVNDKNYNTALLFDGGIRYPGDIAKAIGLGADAVIIGSLFAGCRESAAPIIYDDLGRPNKLYAGSASFHNKGERRFVEGTKKMTSLKWSVVDEVQYLVDGIQGGLSTCGCRNIREMQNTARFVRVTQNGVFEALPHLLSRE